MRAACATSSLMVDVAPTVLEAAGLPVSLMADGVKQQPMDGVSFAPSFTDAKAPSRHTVQYFEILGNRTIYSDGWMAGTRSGILPWNGDSGSIATQPWDFYDLRTDYSQVHDLSAQMPQELEAMKSLFNSEARGNNVYPLDARTGIGCSQEFDLQTSVAEGLALQNWP